MFEDVGALRTARVHYDESGRSLGTAEVIFERRVDAVNAQQKYNTLNLDGMSYMKISHYIIFDLFRSCNGHQTRRRR